MRGASAGAGRSDARFAGLQWTFARIRYTPGRCRPGRPTTCTTSRGTSTPRPPIRTSRAACEPRPPSRSTTRSPSRSRIPASGTIPGSTSSRRQPAVEGDRSADPARVPPARRHAHVRRLPRTDRWDNVEREMKRVFPDRKIIDLPKDHPMFSCFYQMDGFPADARPRIVPAGAHLGEGRLHREPPRD